MLRDRRSVASALLVPSLAFAVPLVLAVPAVAASALQQGTTEFEYQLPLEPLPERPNLLVILLDDLGLDALQLYADELSLTGSAWTGSCAFPSAQRPCLDSLQEIAAHGVAFTNAWTNPSCSPTRAAILTGRYGFRTGIAKPIKANVARSLCDAEALIPEVLPAAYTSAAFGKWHLSKAELPTTPGAEGFPWVNGFDHFEGQLHAVAAKYCLEGNGWTEVRTDPVLGLGVYPPDHSTHVIEEHVRDAIAWIDGRDAPWFCYLAPQAPYELHQWPPAEAAAGCTSIPTNEECNVLGAGASNAVRRQAYDARLEFTDELLSELLDELDQEAKQYGPTLRWWNTTTIFFLGDNGTPNPMAREPFELIGGVKKAKETLYEGGVRVPFLIAGRNVHSARWNTFSDELVHSTDVFATVYGLSGATAATNTIDGVDLHDYLRATPATGLRTELYTEHWDNANGPCFKGDATVDRVYMKVIDDVPWKLHYSRTNQSARRFYDLSADPCEKSGGLTWSQVNIDIRAELMDGILGILNGTCDNQCL